MSAASPPRLLSIAGSDSGGGAGIQADLKTFAAHGAFGMSALTAVTAQNTLRVTRVALLEPEIVAAQIDAVFEDIGVDAVKIGMVATAPIARAIADRLAAWRARGAAPPVVLDPVMVAKSGDALLAEDAVEAIVEDLLPLATLVTPNLPEAERIAGRPAESEAERAELARELARRGPAVLVKGGHGGGEQVVDLLWDGLSLHRFAAPRIHSRHTHGTGCTLSSAIAARLARGESLPAAVEGAIAYLRAAIAAAPTLGRGHGPVAHGHALSGWS